MSEWRDIESAPKDGGLILVAEPPFAVSAVWRHIYQAWMTPTEGTGWVKVIARPTHWMPLPDPPTTG